MCGIVGVFDPRHSFQGSEWNIERMNACLAHRGPDDRGVWVDVESGISLGHRRLAIIDTSNAGAQPMASATGRYVIVFNGEIYNHLDLRRRLAEPSGEGGWRGHSDTETLLACIDQWGIDGTLKELQGMFAFAVWDRQRRRLTVARDRIGEKPLYVGVKNGVLLFASEVRAFQAHSHFSPTVNRNALRYLIDFGYIGKSHSIYEGVRRIAPGTAVTFSASDTGGLSEEIVVFWSAEAAAVGGARLPFDGRFDDAVTQLGTLLHSSVARQLIADVPVGALLSGGIDSSLVTAIARRLKPNDLHTFTIGFEEAEFNEAPFASRVAKHLGTTHHELYVTSRDALDVIPDLPLMYSEPYADSSQIPTALVARLARSRVTVALSGDGGDELFGGYPRYALARHLWMRLSVLPMAVRGGLRQFLEMTSPSVLTTFGGFTRSLLPGVLRRSQLGDDIHKGLPLLEADTFLALYETILRFGRTDQDLVLGTSGQTISEQSLAQVALVAGSVERQAMLLDLIAYLPNDILAKVDRAAMSVGLETRLPLLDHQIVEFAWSLPDEWRGADGVPKRIMRELLQSYLPSSLVERPKMGFSIPVAQWLRGPLRDWAEALLDERRLRIEGYFNAPLLRTLWLEHLSGTRDWQYLLWSVLMFQGWLEDSSRRSS